MNGRVGLPCQPVVRMEPQVHHQNDYRVDQRDENHGGDEAKPMASMLKITQVA